MRRALLIFITLLLTATAADAAKKKGRQRKPQQPVTSQSIKAKQRATSQAIRETSRKIEINTQETERQLNALNLLSAEIKEADASIRSMSQAVDSLNRSIALITDSISLLETNVKNMRSRYARALRVSQGRRQSMGALAFVFSAESFAQAYRRVRYLQQFAAWRDRKTKEIRAAQNLLNTKRELLASMEQQRSSSLKQMNSERASLGRKQAETDRLVASLQQEGGNLKALLRRKEQEARDLDAQLERIIAEEQRRREAQLAEQRRREEEARQARLAEERRQREEAAKKAEQERLEREKAEKDAKDKAETPKTQDDKTKKPGKVKPGERPAQRHPKKGTTTTQPKETKPTTKPTEQPKPTETQGPSAADLDRQAKEDVRLSGDFESNRGRLPFPVIGGYKIVKHFGRQKHPDLKYVETDNSGIDIETSKGARVRAIFPGKVSAIFRQPGFNTIVMVRHGSFLTIYAGLGSIAVKTGDSVNANQAIGTVYSDPEDDGRSILHFELRRERTKLDPEEWLRR